MSHYVLKLTSKNKQLKDSFIIGNTIYFVILVINLVGFYFINKRGSNSINKTLFYYLFFLFTFQVVTTTLASLNINNIVLTHPYFIIQCFFLVYFFSQIIIKPLVLRLIMVYSISALCFLFIQYALSPNLIWRFNIVEVFISNYLIILLSLIYFYQNLGEKKKYQTLVIGVLIYSTFSTIIFLFGNVSSIININIGVALWILNLVVSIIYQILISFQWYSILKSKQYE